MSKVLEVLKKIASKITCSKVIMFLILCFFAALGLSYFLVTGDCKTHMDKEA